MNTGRAEIYRYPVPSFSLAERDRRWGAVRRLMSSAGIEILVAPDEPSARYLSAIVVDVGPVILPLEGEVTALTARRRVRSAPPGWIANVRLADGRWAQAIAERLLELDADRRIVGVVGLDRLLRSPDGDLNYNTFITLREWFPHARWVGAASLVREARYRKSPEEIEFLSTAAAGAEAALLAAAEGLRPGVIDRELWGPMAQAAVAANADPPPSIELGIGSAGESPGLPVGRVIARGDVLVARVRSKYAGYDAAAVQPMAVGELAAEWGDGWRAHLNAWERAWELLRPGVPIREIDRRTASSKGRYRVQMELVGQGLGDDLPYVHDGHLVEDDTVLAEGACFVLCPQVEWGTGRARRVLSWGDTVVVTPEGPRRLGARPHELIEVGG